LTAGRRLVAPGMSSLVMLRWIVPARRPYASPRELIEALISPAVRASGWLCSPGTTHYVSDRGSEAWVTVVTQIDDATEIQDDLAELLNAPPALETTYDALLAPGSEWYREALQVVTHVGLDVIEARGTIPLSEYAAFESPSEAASVLIPFLNEVSGTYRRTCPTYRATEMFWLDFFRRAPAPELSRAGHWLWNLAG